MIDPLLFRTAVEQTKDYALFLLDRDGLVVSWNMGAQRIKGYAAEDIIGRHFSTFYTRDAVESGWPDYELKVAAAEGRFEDEGWRVRKDGSRFWANVVITALRDESGRLLGYSKITRDLTVRKLQEEALRQSEERFRLLVDGVVDYAIFMLDPEGIVSSWNAGAERMKGYKPNEIIGKHFSRFFVPEDSDAGQPWEELATARRTGRCESEGWRVKKNGDRFWARVVVTALYNTEGELRGFAKVTQDLTDRRQIQNLERAAKNLNEFIAVLAHELRNPLAPIRNAVEVLSKMPAGDPKQELMRNTIARQSAQLARIVDDMLDITRITRGELTIDRAVVDMRDVARFALETAGPAIEAGKHRLDVRLTQDALLVQGDVQRLTQLVSNLLNNAARYTAEGGTIVLSTRAESGWAVLSVRDNGRGIHAQALERIFDMFVHGRPMVERAGGGLGIGLAVARRIAELHHGTLHARSEGENKGSEFILRVPLSREAAESARPHSGSSVATQHIVPRRVLVVDDNVDAATALDLLLKSLGHETCVVHEGSQALQKATDFRPDVVLLDIGMPGLDGYETAKRLRALKPALRIVAVTGWGQETDRQKSHDAGFDLHLVKPIDASVLTKALSARNGATLH